MGIRALNMSVRRRKFLLYIIGEFKRKIGREITLTRLVKLLYLVDKELSKRGFPPSGTKWIRWYYGPYSDEVRKDLDELISSGLVKREYIPTGAGIIEVYKTKRGVKLDLEPEVANIIDELISKYGSMEFSKLLEEVYSTFDRNIDLGGTISLEPSN